jgi:hypothetical protein
MQENQSGVYRLGRKSSLCDSEAKQLQRIFIVPSPSFPLTTPVPVFLGGNFAVLRKCKATAWLD